MFKIKSSEIEDIEAYRIVCESCGEDWIELWWENFDGRCPHCGELCEIEEEKSNQKYKSRNGCKS